MLSWNNIASGMMGGMWTWFVNTLFGGSGTKTLHSVINSINDTKWPQLDATWFMAFWKQSFGLAVVVSLFALFVTLIVTIGFESKVMPLNAALDFFKLLGVGFFLLLGLQVVMIALGWLTTFIVTLSSVGVVKGKWYDALEAADNLANLPAVGIGYFLDSFFGALLKTEIALAQSSVLIFSIMFMLTFSLYRFKVGHLLLRISMAGLITALTIKIISVSFLAIGSFVLRADAATGVNAIIQATFILGLAGYLPIAVFWSSMKRIHKVQIEGPTFSRSVSGDGSNSYSVGSANQRHYVNTEPGYGMDKVATVASKASSAAVAAAVVFPEVAPVLLAVSKGAAVASNGARWKSGQQRQADQKKQEVRQARHNG